VGLVDEVAPGSQIAFDSNALIYFVEEHPKYLPVVEPVIELIKAGQGTGHVATVSYMEVMVAPLQKQAEVLAAAYRDVFAIRRDFRLHSLTRPIAERAALTRARFSLRTPDAIVAATALEHGCSHLITNDPTFRRVEGLRVLVIDDYV
jgi:predicted nucleic acid-binding protein